MNNQEVIDYIGDKLGYTSYGGPVGGVTTQRAAMACDALLKLCLEKGTVDNISVILIVLGAPSIMISKNLTMNNNNPTTSTTPIDHHPYTSSMISTPKTSIATTTNPRVPCNTPAAIATTTLRTTPQINHMITIEHEVDVDLPIYTSNSYQNSGSLFIYANIYIYTNL